MEILHFLFIVVRGDLHMERNERKAVVMVPQEPSDPFFVSEYLIWTP